MARRWYVRFRPPSAGNPPADRAASAAQARILHDARALATMGALLKGHNATQRCHFRALVARATDLTFRLAAYARRDADLTPHMVDAVRLCAIYICIYIYIYI